VGAPAAVAGPAADDEPFLATPVEDGGGGGGDAAGGGRPPAVGSDSGGDTIMVGHDAGAPRGATMPGIGSDNGAPAVEREPVDGAALTAIDAALAR